MNSNNPDTTTAPPPAWPEQLLRQARTIAELRAALTQMEHDHTDTTLALTERLTTLENHAGDTRRAAPTVQAWCWRNLGDDATEALHDELTEWVTWLRHRYPLNRRLPDCWHQHSELVEELTALWVAWQAAYTEPNPPLTAPIEWHDRWLPGLLHRLDHGPHATDCTTSHHDRPTTAYAERRGGNNAAGTGQ